MEKKSLGRSFMILSFAGIFIKILSAAYVPLLTAVIGSDAYASYSISYTIFTFILAVTSLGAQPAITKVVAEYRAVGNSIDALRAMKISRKYMTIIGVFGTIILLVLAKPIALASTWDKSILAIMFLSPTILFSCIVSVYRGYMQGIEDMETIGISQIIEQIINVVLSLVFAGILIKISEEMGIAGGTVGTTLGAVVAIIYIIFIYEKREYEEEAYSSNTIEKRHSEKTIARKILMYALPITLVAALQNSSPLVDAMIVKRRLAISGIPKESLEVTYAYLSYFNTLLYVPLALVTALSTAIFPKVISAYTCKNRKELRSNISYSYRITFMITIPSLVGLTILGKEVFNMLFGLNEGYELLMYGSIVLVFMSITTIQNTILQGVNKLYLVLYTAFIGVVLKLILDFILVAIPEINIFGAVIASFVSYLVPTIINHRNLRKIFRVRVPIIKLLLAPIIASLSMGVVIAVIRMPMARLINIFEGGRLMISVETLIMVAIGGMVYLLVMILIGGITKTDLDLISPKVYRIMPRFLRKMM